MGKITDSDLITEDKADFLLAEAKEQLTATVADAEALTKSGVYLLGGLLTVITALVGVAGAQWREILVAAEMGNHRAAVVDHALRGSGCRDDHVDGAFLKRT
jgi:hypothetical protein